MTRTSNRGLAIIYRDRVEDIVYGSGNPSSYSQCEDRAMEKIRETVIDDLVGTLRSAFPADDPEMAVSWSQFADWLELQKGVPDVG